MRFLFRGLRRFVKAAKWGVAVLLVWAAFVYLLALPYAERSLQELLQAVVPQAVLERSQLSWTGLAYQVRATPQAEPMVRIALDLTRSLIERRVVINQLDLNLDERWALVGVQEAAQGRAASIRLLERPLAFPDLPLTLSHLTVTTPLGPLEAQIDLADGKLTAQGRWLESSGQLVVVSKPQGAYALTLDVTDGPYPLGIVVEGGQAEPLIEITSTGGSRTWADIKLSEIQLHLNSSKIRGYSGLPVSLQASLNGQPLSLTGTLDLAKMSAQVEGTASYKQDGMEVHDLTLKANLRSMWPLDIAEGAEVRAAALQLGGLPLVQPQVRFAYRENRLALKSASAALFGGRVDLAPTGITFPVTQAKVTAKFRDLDLQQVLQLAAVDGLGGDGHLSGEVPIEVAGRKITLGQAQLQTSSTGQIHYAPQDMPSFLAPGGSGEMLGQVFSDFRYSALVLSLGGTVGDNLTLKARLEGSNPSFYNGHSVAFNLNLSGALESLLTQGLQSFRFTPEDIRRLSEEGSKP